MRIDWNALAVDTGWRAVAPVEPARTYEAFAFHLRMRSPAALIPFTRWSTRVWGQVPAAPGLVGFSDRTPLLSPLGFITRSAWRDVASLTAFVRTPPHAQALAELRPLVSEFTQVRWPLRGSALPPPWPEVMRMLASGQRTTR